MTPYRVSRRAFLASVGGAVGLKILLRNLEAAAEGASSPPRFLMAYWPNGTLKAKFLPTGGRTDFQISPILAPFEAAGLRPDMTILFGLETKNRCPGGGGSEAGTVFVTTGADAPGTRANGGEGDDAVAGGPSFDQIFLKLAPALQVPGVGYVNTLCDARVDSLETSTQCLSYSYTQRGVTSANPGGSIVENIPLFPALSPAQVYATLFASFVPGNDAQSTALRALRTRKSVLDSSLRELSRLRALAPSSQREKIDFHAEAVRKVELELQAKLDAAENATPACVLPSAPDPSIVGKSGSHNDYGNEKVAQGDDVQLELIGKLHLSLIRTAFQCDLTRVATFQWCPGSNHVAFQGLYPDDPAGAYMHHPMTHRVGDPTFFTGPAPLPGSANRSLYDFLCNVQTWFNQKTADALVEFKNAKDAFGNSLLDYTIVPFVTELADPSDSRAPMPALIFGGKALGMLGGQFVRLNELGNPAAWTSFNALWLTIAQAYFPDRDVLEVLKDQAFMRSNLTAQAVIAGLWQRPA